MPLYCVEIVCEDVDRCGICGVYGSLSHASSVIDCIVSIRKVSDIEAQYHEGRVLTGPKAKKKLLAAYKDEGRSCEYYYNVLLWEFANTAQEEEEEEEQAAEADAQEQGGEQGGNEGERGAKVVASGSGSSIPAS